MAESIASLNIALRATGEKLAADINAGIAKAQNQTSVKAVALGTALGAGIVAGVSSALAGIKSAINLAFEGLDRIDALDEAAAKIGMTYNGLQNLKFAAETTGGSFEGMVSAIGKMQANLASGSASKAMQRLGLDMERVRQLAPEQQFAEISQALSEIQNTGEKIDLTKTIFGKGGVDLLNVINGGKAGLSEMARTVQGLGGHLSDVQRTMVTMAYGDIEALKQGWGFVKDQLAVGISPILRAITDQVLTFAQQAGGIGPLIQTWVNGIVQFSAYVADAAQWVQVVFNYIQTGGQTAVAVFQTIGTAIGAAVAMGEQQIKLLIQALAVGARTVKQAFLEVVYVVEKAVIDSLNRISNLVSEAANKLAKLSNKVLDTEEGITPLAERFGRVANNRVAVGQPNEPLDMPTKPQGEENGPDASLFGTFEPPPKPQLPDDLVVDYTGLGNQLSLTNQTTAESFRVVKDVAVDTFSTVGDSAAEANAKLLDAANGITWGDKIKESANKAAEETKRMADAQVANIQNANNASIQSDLAKVNASTALAGQEAAAKIGAAQSAAKGIEQAHERAYDQVSQMSQNATTDIVTAWATGTGKISDIVNQWAQQMIRQFIQVSLWGNKSAGGSYAGIIGGLGSSLGGGGGGGGGTNWTGWASAIGSLFGGFFADGGRPPMGKVSVVGERGPELFVPDSAGRIVPNAQAAAMMGGRGSQQQASSDPPIIVNQNFGSGLTHADVAALMDEMQDRTTEGVREAIRRGGSYRKSVQS